MSSYQMYRIAAIICGFYVVRRYFLFESALAVFDLSNTAHYFNSKRCTVIFFLVLDLSKMSSTTFTEHA
jgi:hypothetical protein